MRSSILARIPGFRQRIIPEPHVPSRGSQARGTKSVFGTNPRLDLRAVPSGFWLGGGGGEIKNLGPLPFGAPFSRNQRIFPENTGEGGRPPNFFQTLQSGAKIIETTA